MVTLLHAVTMFESKRYRKAIIGDVEVTQSKGFYVGENEWDVPEIIFGSSSDKSIAKAKEVQQCLQQAIELAEQWAMD